MATYWEQIIKINDWQQKESMKLLSKNYLEQYQIKSCNTRICFKANTNDTRESPAIKICSFLIEEGAKLSIHDPKVSKNKIEMI